MNILLILTLSLFITALSFSGYLMFAYYLGRRSVARFYDHPGYPRDDGVRIDLDAVQNLRVLPLLDRYAAHADLEIGNGVSYLVQADDTSILFDLGGSQPWENGTPALLHNMLRLGVNPASDLDFVFISHPHDNHLGGPLNRLTHRAIVRKGKDLLCAGKPVYTTEPLKAAGGMSQVVKHPRVLAPGIATTGPLPVQFFLLGYTLEQALIVNVAGKGLVVIVGCAHPGVDAIIERAEQIFQVPIYGIIGGLHLPTSNEQPAKAEPSPQQKPADFPNHPSWELHNEDITSITLAYLKSKRIRFVSLSAHDSNDWSLPAFVEAFGDDYQPLEVGKAIQVRGDLLQSPILLCS